MNTCLMVIRIVLAICTMDVILLIQNSNLNGLYPDRPDPN